MTIKTPANLSKEARGIFKKIVRVRGDAAMPIVPGEVDLVADYAAVRHRLLKLGEFLETDAVKASPQLFLATVKQIDASVQLSARLAKQLRLEDTRIDTDRLSF